MDGATQPMRKKKKNVTFDNEESAHPEHTMDPIDPVVLGGNSLYVIRERSERKVLMNYLSPK